MFRRARRSSPAASRWRSPVSRPSRRPPPAPRHADFTVQPSVEQVAVTGASAGATAVLRAADGTEGRAPRPIDAAGSVLFRDVGPGAGYVVSVGERPGGAGDGDEPHRHAAAVALHVQHLGPGYGYLKHARRHAAVGQRHAARTRRAVGPTPPWSSTRATTRRTPTATQPASRHRAAARLRHRGREPARHRLLRRRVRLLRGRSSRSTATTRSRPSPRSRGSLHGTVGMVGHLVPGHHPAVRRARRALRTSPRSRRSRCSTTPTPRCIPGGIFNNGFALGWAKDRQADARPSTSSGGGQGWASKRIAAGDETCRANQALRLQAPGVLARDPGQRLPPRRGDRRARAGDVRPRHRRAGVPRRRVAGPGDRQPLRRTCSATSRPDIPMKVTLMNGVHQDSLGPAVLSEWIEFLDFYVAKRIPSVPPAAARAGHDRPVPSVRAGRVAGTRPLHERARLRVGAACLRSRAEGAGAVRRRGRERRRCPRSRRRRRRSRCRAPPRPRGTWATTARSPIRHPPSAAADRFRVRPVGISAHDDRRSTTASPPDVRLEAGPRRQGRRVRHRAAHRRHRARRHRQRRPVGAGDDARRRPRGDDQRGASGRQGDLRAERLAARQPARARRRRRPPRSLPVQTHARADVAPLPKGTPTAGARAAVSRSATRSGPARGSASWCSRPAATGRQWAFAAIDATEHRHHRCARRAHPSKVVLPVVAGRRRDAPGCPACDTLRGQPCRNYVAP